MAAFSSRLRERLAAIKMKAKYDYVIN